LVGTPSESPEILLGANCGALNKAANDSVGGRSPSEITVLRVISCFSLAIVNPKVVSSDCEFLLDIVRPVGDGRTGGKLRRNWDGGEKNA